MNKTVKVLWLAAAFAVAALPLLSQTSANRKPSFEVVSIKPSAPLGAGLLLQLPEIRSHPSSPIQDLGLRLESAKGPVEVLVVDSAQKPREN